MQPIQPRGGPPPPAPPQDRPRGGPPPVRLVAVAALALCTACSDFGIRDPAPVPPAPPPGKDEDNLGGPPDWQNCFEGFHGEYSNLSVDHPDVRMRSRMDASTNPDELDWWSEPTFQRFDPTLDMGGNWWPVDEGLEADPNHFAVRWRAWLRAWSNTTMTVTLGSSDDAWVYIDNRPVIEQPGLQDFDPQQHTIDLDGGQYPIEILFAHRDAADVSGFRFRVLSGDVSLCYPDFEEDEAEE